MSRAILYTMKQTSLLPFPKPNTSASNHQGRLFSSCFFSKLFGFFGNFRPLGVVTAKFPGTSLTSRSSRTRTTTTQAWEAERIRWSAKLCGEKRCLGFVFFSSSWSFCMFLPSTSRYVKWGWVWFWLGLGLVWFGFSVGVVFVQFVSLFVMFFLTFLILPFVVFQVPETEGCWILLACCF